MTRDEHNAPPEIETLQLKEVIVGKVTRNVIQLSVEVWGIPEGSRWDNAMRPTHNICADPC